ncbi:hypothetical protein [Streptomyces sp. NPDC046759]|uniref:hypothetical protein n=1 Tax=Streptomyces sp. NPDC046759 TaxID=3155019 RepID=UPI0034024A59
MQSGGGLPIGDHDRIHGTTLAGLVPVVLPAHELSLSTAGVVGAYAVYNLAYAAISYPAPEHCPTILPRPLVFAAGLVSFAIGSLGLGLVHAPWLVFVALSLYGGCAACTDGVGKAWTSTLVF